MGIDAQLMRKYKEVVRNVAATWDVDLNDDQVLFLLWNKTPFPYATFDHVTSDINKHFASRAFDYSTD